MKFIETESQMDKYAFYFEGQSYTILSPEAVAIANTGGKTSKASHSKYGRFSISDKMSPDHKGCQVMRLHHKRVTTAD